MYQDIADKKRAAFFFESITPSLSRTAALSLDRREPVSYLSTYSRLNTMLALDASDKLEAVYFHHQGYNLDTAHGITASASSVTLGGIQLDVVAEDLQQNITLTQAHPEFSCDETVSATTGLGSKVSASVAESIFGQFAMRVHAFKNSRQLESKTLPSRTKPHYDSAHDLTGLGLSHL